MALSNFQMKIIDLKGKRQFFILLNAQLKKIRVGLQEDVGNSMSEAYIRFWKLMIKMKIQKNVVLDKQRQEMICK